MLDQLKELLSKHDISAPIEWNTEKPTRESSQWFIGKKWKLGDKDFYAATFGDFKRDIKVSWSSEKDLSETEKAQAKKHTDSILALEKAEREKVQLELASILEAEFQTFASTGDTPYMRRKQINRLFGARIKPNTQGDPILVVPVRDIDGKFWNYQRIYGQKLSKGDKFFEEGARIDGGFHLLEWGETKTPAQGSPIYICEGFATAAALAQSLGDNGFIVAAFNAGNLQAVATSFKGAYPQSTIVICADNDAYTVLKRAGVEKPYNVGIEKGRRAAGATQGKIVYPVFKYPQKGLTDFNDLYCAEGKERVKDQVEHFEKYVHGIQPMCLEVTKNGRVKIPSEKEVCDYVLEHYTDRIVRQDRSLFVYRGNHWVELDPMGEDQFKQKIQVAANGQLGVREIENYFRYIKMHAPQVPKGVDLYQPNPFAANFLNGTLHIYRNGDKKYHVDFRPHDRHDYLTSVLPFDCPAWKPGEELPPAPLFDQMVETLWGSNPDKEEIKILIHELIGGALMPAFPTITYFFGPPDSGKSTIIKLLVRLVSKENVSNVQPCDFHGFNMETMVGKLVNFDTDIDTNKPFSDSEIKKIIDRNPRRIRRKNRTDVTGFLPAMHLFAGNQLPKTLDGNSHAYERRLTIIKTNTFKAPPNAQFDYEVEVLNEEMAAVVARGLLGIYRLAEQNGRYTKLASSTKLVQKFEAPSDIVGCFIEEVKDGEVRDNNNIVKSGDEYRIERKNLWELFSNWQSDSFPIREQIGKVQFFQQLERKGFETQKSDGYHYFKGMGVRVTENSVS